MLFADAEDGSHKTCLDQEPPDRAKSAMLLWKFEGGGGPKIETNMSPSFFRLLFSDHCLRGEHFPSSSVPDPTNSALVASSGAFGPIVKQKKQVSHMTRASVDAFWLEVGGRVVAVRDNPCSPAKQVTFE